MADDEVLELHAPGVQAVIRPREGAVAASLRVNGTSVLARTPWHDDVDPDPFPAATESEWVARWRGGWQLCFPNAGQPERGAAPAQGFHGAASQAPWLLVDRTARECVLEWADAEGLRVRRRWRLHRDGLAAESTAWNDGADRVIGIAEHLILGDDLLAPVAAGGSVVLQAPARTEVAELDYDGEPTGASAPWPAGDWDRADLRTPARVCALRRPGPRRVDVTTAQRVSVSWRGLDHALIWEEFSASQEPPWGGKVLALGVEPTTTPHGAGTGRREGGLTLARGQRMDWSARLRVSG